MVYAPGAWFAVLRGDNRHPGQIQDWHIKGQDKSFVQIAKMAYALN